MSLVIPTPIPREVSTQVATVDFLSLPADDYKVGGARTVAASGGVSSVTLSPHNAANATTLAIDGTGFRIVPSGTQQLNQTLDNAPGFSWTPSDEGKDAEYSHSVGVAFQIAASPTRPSSCAANLAWMSSSGGNPTVATIRQLETNSLVVRQTAFGGADVLDTVAVGALVRRFAGVQVNGAVIFYYSTTTGDVTAADFEDMRDSVAPTGWVRVTGAFGPYVALQSSATCDIRSYLPGATNAVPVRVLISESVNGADYSVERAWFAWNTVAAP